MAKAYKCDICGKLTEVAHDHHSIVIDANHNKVILTYCRLDKRFDLCDECKVTFLQKTIEKIKQGDSN